MALEKKISSLEQKIKVVNHNIQYLKKLEKDLILNISFLKRDKIITIASEYKKTTKELETVRKELTFHIETLNALTDEYNTQFKELKQDLKKYNAIAKDKKIILFNNYKRK